MINDDTLVKWSISRIKDGHLVRSNWVDYTRLLQDQILYITLGFPGIGKSDLSLVSSESVYGQPGKRIIIDDNLDTPGGFDTAAIMGVIKEYSPEEPWKILLEIDGLGQGTDFSRDPDRKLRWRTSIEVNLKDYPTILVVDSKPRVDGGPVYYYFMKHNRDSRW